MPTLFYQLFAGFLLLTLSTGLTIPIRSSVPSFPDTSSPFALLSSNVEHVGQRSTWGWPKNRLVARFYEEQAGTTEEDGMSLYLSLTIV